MSDQNFEAAKRWMRADLDHRQSHEKFGLKRVPSPSDETESS
jgi:hypothetical protein